MRVERAILIKIKNVMSNNYWFNKLIRIGEKNHQYATGMTRFMLCAIRHLKRAIREKNLFITFYRIKNNMIHFMPSFHRTYKN